MAEMAVEMRFSVQDYVVVAAMLMVSLGIGLYQACTGGHQRTTEEFLMADRKMNPVPVALSLTASFVSAITFLGIPAEGYVNGVMYTWYALSAFLACAASMTLFLPIFFKLELTSANEYLERRFNRPTRLLGSFCFAFYMTVYLGVVLYAPSLALNAVTGMNLWGSVLAIGIVCMIYTTIGGMKAVLWTDTFQGSLMIIGLFVVLIAGAVNVGGMDDVWRIAGEGQRLNLWIWDTDITVRHTIWGIVIGGTWNSVQIMGVNQVQVQRCLACGSLKTARIAIGLGMIGMIITTVVPILVGVVMYATYVDCDPRSAGYVDSFDQLIPYFIMDMFGSMPGLTGFFTSAVFSAALSTLSSGMNALAAIAVEDVVKGIWPRLEESRYTMLSKVFAFLFGVLTILTALLVSSLGQNVLQASLNAFSMFSGPTLGLFSCGMFFPWINSKGAFTGACTGLVFAFWVGLGAQFNPSYPPNMPPLSTAGCLLANTTQYWVTEEFNATTAIYEEFTLIYEAEDRSPVTNFYRLAYTWWGISAWTITTIVALLVSLLTGPQDPRKLDPRLICPIVDKMFCCLPERWKKPLRCGVGEEYEEDKEMQYEYQTITPKEDANYGDKNDKIDHSDADGEGQTTV